MLSNQYLRVAIVLLITIWCELAQGEPLIWICDSDGTLGTVDIETGQVQVIGEMSTTMTDIAFDESGQLWGISGGWLGSSLYKIDRTNAEISRIGSMFDTFNSLVFSSDGTLYAANTSLYKVDIETGFAWLIGSDGSYESSGDLAFVNNQLYLTSDAWGGTDHLYRLDVSSGVGTYVGDIGIDEVFGLASDDNVNLYGISGTKVLEVDVSNGTSVELVDYDVGRVAWNESKLDEANGAAFISESNHNAASTMSFNAILSVGDKSLSDLIGEEIPVFGQFTVNLSATSTHEEQSDDCSLNVYPFEEFKLNVGGTQYVLSRSDVERFEPGFGVHIWNCPEDSSSLDSISIHLFTFLSLTDPLEPIVINGTEIDIETIFIDAIAQPSAFSGLNAANAKEFSSRFMNMKSVQLEVDVNGSSYMLYDSSSVFSSSETSNLADGYVVSIDGVDISELLDVPDWHTANTTHYLFDAISSDWNLVLTEVIGPVIHFDWSRNPAETEESVVALIVALEKLSHLARERGSELRVVAHSWGTVLTYIAAEMSDSIVIDKFVSLGSPLGAQSTLIQLFTKEKLDNFGLDTDIKKAPAGLKSWDNYWYDCDEISGPIQGLRKTRKKAYSIRKRVSPHANPYNIYWVDTAGVENIEIPRIDLLPTTPECHSLYYTENLGWEGWLLRASSTGVSAH